MKLECLTIRTWPAVFVAAGMLAGCGKEPPPTSVNDFMENAILLEATIVRCSENRIDTRYDAECINAREATDRLAAAKQATRRAELEAQSERKRQALRRAQEAAAEARRRAFEEQKRQEEAEYLGQFEPLPEGKGAAGQPAEPREDAAPPRQEPPPQDDDAGETEPPPDSPPPASTSPGASPAVTEDPDLGSIRRELERRQSQDAPPATDDEPRQL